ncbi:MAG TPA: metalloregulator ArsR/SmtB family transcription factor [Polyangiaceae bacterium]|nr:metalloregulator ArsR/SmtB family transcription factor [Polyangiaceae bacterium]
MKRPPVPQSIPVPDEALAQMAVFFRAASDAGRLKLLSWLMTREATVTELATLAKLPMSTVSQQLRLLRNEKLVKRRRSGKQLFYSLADAPVHELFAVGLAYASRDDGRAER